MRPVLENLTFSKLDIVIFVYWFLGSAIMKLKNEFYESQFVTERATGFSPHPHFAGEIWKRSFISPITPTIHTNPSRKRSFSKTLFKPEEFEIAAWRFSAEENIFENGAFRKRWRHDFPARVLLKRKSKMAGDCYVFKFLRRSEDGAS